MSQLQIYDLSVCEIANHNQVQGGLLANMPGSIFELLETYVPTFTKLSSEQTERYLLEEYSDHTGENYGYQMSSLDGKQIVAGASGQINNVGYVISFASTST